MKKVKSLKTGIESLPIIHTINTKRLKVNIVFYFKFSLIQINEIFINFTFKSLYLFYLLNYKT
jgi:hypothetical protein